VASRPPLVAFNKLYRSSNSESEKHIKVSLKVQVDFCEKRGAFLLTALDC
jgi:hypothetical protein